MIDELIQYIKTNPDVNAETTIVGEEIRCANRFKVTNHFLGTTILSYPRSPKRSLRTPPKTHGHKRREPTPLDLTTKNFPALKQNKKVRFDLPESESFTTEPRTDPDMSSSVLVDFDTEMANERARNEQGM
jgi:hypothetical protein